MRFAVKSAGDIRDWEASREPSARFTSGAASSSPQTA